VPAPAAVCGRAAAQLTVVVYGRCAVDEESSGLATGRGLRARPVSLLGKCISGDCEDGDGVYVWDSGEIYEGHFKHGRMHGRSSKYTWNDVPNNTTYEYVGDFDHGEMPRGCVAGNCRGRPETTRGVYIWPNGEEYVGEWRSGLMEGDGTYRWPDGEHYEGEWREGKRYGEGINNYALGTNPSPFYDGYWEYDEPVEDYPNSVYAGH
jgi:hypothetical protein